MGEGGGGGVRASIKKGKSLKEDNGVETNVLTGMKMNLSKEGRRPREKPSV